MGLFRNAVKPRLIRILCHRNVAIAVGSAISIFAAFRILHLPSLAPSIKVLDIVGPVLALTTVGFAVSVTALALVLALPLNRAVALMVVTTEKDDATQIIEVDGRLATADPKSNTPVIRYLRSPETSGYLSLVFVFIWTAVANVWASIWGIFAACISGDDELLSSQVLATHLVLAAFGGSLTYALLQMSVALSTVYEVADLFQQFSAEELRRNAERIIKKQLDISTDRRDITEQLPQKRDTEDG